MTDPASLLSRIEATKGPDRELSTEINLFAGVERAPAVGAAAALFLSDNYVGKHVTGSLDAIVELIEWRLPGWVRKVSSDNGQGVAEAWLFDPLGRFAFKATHADERLALCAALVRAASAA